ncbi:glycosyltransferase family 32 protein [Pseudomonas putida]|uniref:Glycosyl transferase n=1 Tax=Pseudomonas putida TaxID=303 RepID=A0A1Q9R5C4_PSEPU|nr:glycosyltransferase [Pseudomonas putida]OLS62619.1 hypothetical protein PSEMO_23810 [Pseudomonas putida]
MIAKKIHYCWFGGKPLPLLARRCLASWARHLPDYEILRWDESNIDVYAHPFTAAAHNAGRYAFVADYVRMQVLAREGGIYLDTDVEVLAPFAPMLDNQLFIGLEWDARFGTSVIGAVPGHWLPKAMLAWYDRVRFDTARLSELVNVNEVSRLLLVKGFAASHQEQVIGWDRVYPVGVFADPHRQAPDGVRPTARHLYAGSWRNRPHKGLLSRAWRSLRKAPGNLGHGLQLCRYQAATWVRQTLKDKGNTP